MENLFKERDRVMELWCTTVGKDMTVNGMLINVMEKVSRYLQMEVSMKDVIIKTKCMVKGNIYIQMVRHIKESGKITWNMEVVCGSILKVIAMLVNGLKDQQQDLESLHKQMQVDMKVHL